jgi:hypothetical protein
VYPLSKKEVYPLKNTKNTLFKDALISDNHHCVSVAVMPRKIKENTVNEDLVKGEKKQFISTKVRGGDIYYYW